MTPIPPQAAKAHDRTVPLTRAQTRFLKSLFPGEQSLFAPEETLVYGTDGGRLYAPPQAVVRPTDRGQVVELLKWAQAERMPIYPRARATNLVGGTVPVMGGVVVSCLSLNRVLDIDDRDFAAEVEPGVITGELQALLVKRNLFYPPDAASAAFSTVGGNISTNAGGLRAVKYGVTRDYVLGLEAVLPGGEVIHTGGRFHKNVVGLDLTRLLVGSAGSLAFITQLTLKLLPLPEATASLLAGFASVPDAMEAARLVFQNGILPVAMEFMDRTAMKALELTGQTPLPPNLGAALLLMVDGSEAGVAEDVKRLETAVRQANPTHVSMGRGQEQEKLWDVRRMINPASFHLGPGKLADDIALPRGRLGEALEKIQAIGEEAGLPILCFGHLGDGNLHVNVMHDPDAPGELARAKQAKARILETTLSLNGTVSGEHGTGLVKQSSVPLQLGPVERRLMQGVKRTFDPHGIMNPGKALY